MKRRLLYGGLAIGMSILPGQTEAEPSIITQEAPRAIERFEAQFDTQQIVEKHIGKTVLEITDIGVDSKANDFPNSLVVNLKQADSCAVEYSFPKDPSENEMVYVGIFGKVDDMADSDKINGPSMYDGTFGHGDTDGVTTDGIPTSTLVPEQQTPNTIVGILEFMEEKTKTICEAFEEHIADSESGYPG